MLDNKTSIKVIKIKNKNNFFIFYKNLLGTYLLVSSTFINIKVLDKIQLPFNSYNISVKTNSDNFICNLLIKKNISLILSNYIKRIIDLIIYPRLVKFWLLGRFYRIKRSKKRF